MRRSAKTRSWEKAEEFKRRLEAEFAAKQNGRHELAVATPEKMPVKDGITRFLNSKRSENLAESTLDKLRTIFEKQFLSWASAVKI